MRWIAFFLLLLGSSGALDLKFRPMGPEFPKSNLIRVTPKQMQSLRQIDPRVSQQPSRVLSSEATLQAFEAAALVHFEASLLCGQNGKVLLGSGWRILESSSQRFLKTDSGWKFHCQPQESMTRLSVRGWFDLNADSGRMTRRLPFVNLSQGVVRFQASPEVRQAVLNAMGRRITSGQEIPSSSLAKGAYLKAFVSKTQGIKATSQPTQAMVEVQKGSRVQLEGTHSVKLREHAVEVRFSGSLRVSGQPLQSLQMHWPQGMSLEKLNIARREYERPAAGRLNLPFALRVDRDHPFEIVSTVKVPTATSSYGVRFELPRFLDLDSVKEWLSFQVVDVIELQEPSFEYPAHLVRADPTEIKRSRNESMPHLYAYRLLKNPGRVHVQGKALKELEIPEAMIRRARLNLNLNADGSALATMDLDVMQTRSGLFPLPLPQGADLKILKKQGREVPIQRLQDNRAAIYLNSNLHAQKKDPEPIQLSFVFLLPPQSNSIHLHFPLQIHDRNLKVHVRGEALKEKFVEFDGPLALDAPRMSFTPAKPLSLSALRTLLWPTLLILGLVLLLLGSRALRQVVQAYAAEENTGPPIRRALNLVWIPLILFGLGFFLEGGHLLDMMREAPSASFVFDSVQPPWFLQSSHGQKAQILAGSSEGVDLVLNLHSRLPVLFGAPLFLLLGIGCGWLPLAWQWFSPLGLAGLSFFLESYSPGSSSGALYFFLIGFFLHAIFPWVRSLKWLLALFFCIRLESSDLDLFVMEDADGQLHHYMQESDYRQRLLGTQPESFPSCSLMSQKLFAAPEGILADLHFPCAKPPAFQAPAGWILLQGGEQSGSRIRPHQQHLRFFLAESFEAFTRASKWLKLPEPPGLEGLVQLPCSFLLEPGKYAIENDSGSCEMPLGIQVSLPSLDKQKTVVPKTVDAEERALELDFQLQVEEGRADAIADFQLRLSGVKTRELFIRESGPMVPYKATGNPSPIGLKIVQGGYLLQWANPLGNRVRFQVHSAARLDPNTGVGLPSLADQTSYRARIRVDASPDIALQAALSSPYRALSEGEVEGLQPGPIVSARSLPPSPAISLAYTPREGIQPETAHVDEFTVDVFASSSHKLFISRRISLRASGRQYFRLTLNEGEQVLGTAVQGRRFPVGHEHADLWIPIPELRDHRQEAATVHINISSVLPGSSNLQFHPGHTDMTVSEMKLCFSQAPSQNLYLQGDSSYTVLNASKSPLNSPNPPVDIAGPAGYLPPVPVVQNRQCLAHQLIPPGKDPGKVTLELKPAVSGNQREWHVFLMGMLFWSVLLGFVKARTLILSMAFLTFGVALFSIAIAGPFAAAGLACLAFYCLVQFSRYTRAFFGRQV